MLRIYIFSIFAASCQFERRNKNHHFPRNEKRKIMNFSSVPLYGFEVFAIIAAQNK